MAARHPPKVIYAANRAIGARGLEILLEAGVDIVGLLLPAAPAGSHNEDMKRMAPHAHVVEIAGFGESEALKELRLLACDYLLSIHFPHIFPRSVLSIPNIGTLNLHPALLPFNRGWHTPSWAILDKTPVGVTLHWVDEGIDSGDLALQYRVEIRPDDTADKLYKRLLQTELELLNDAIPLLKDGRLPRTAQEGQGTFHRKRDLHSVQRLDLSRSMPLGAAIDLLRSLTTSDASEAAYFEVNGQTYVVRVDIQAR